MTSAGNLRQLALAFEQQLRLHASHIDLRNRGRYRSTHLVDEFFFELVGLAKPQLFVEAGAFDAMASRRVARERLAARVVAFEANPSNYRLWTHEVDFAAHGVDYLHLALSDAPGPVTFHLRSAVAAEAGEVFEDNSLLPRVGGQQRTSDDVVTVEATTLDLEFSDRGTRAAMWVDVEGANREVLSGGSAFLRRCDVVKIEVEDVPLWAGQWLASDVFEAMLGAGLTPLARDVQAEGQYNVVFVSEDLMRDGSAVTAHDRLLRRQLASELPGVVGRLRRNATVRRAARVLRPSSS